MPLSTIPTVRTMFSIQDIQTSVFMVPTDLKELDEQFKRAANGQDNELAAQMFIASIKTIHEGTHYGVLKYRGLKAFWLLAQRRYRRRRSRCAMGVENVRTKIQPQITHQSSNGPDRSLRILLQKL